jgi:hypothetical protein
LGVAALIFLIIGLLCAIVGRILLIGAAFAVSVWWGLGVFLPFGPLLFRLSYPDAAERSRMFRLATLPCILLYLLLGHGWLLNSSQQHHHFNSSQPAPAQATGYALERPGHSIIEKSAAFSPAIKVGSTPALAEREAANAGEFARLRAWDEKLRLQKRDLLHSDMEGTRAYNNELAQYNAALEDANAEKASLAALTK